MSEESKDFIIKDRRLFAQENEGSGAEKETASADAHKAEEKAPEADPAKEAEDRGETVSEDTDEAFTEPLPAITFPTFIFSLNSSVLLHLGLLEDPVSGKKTKNLPLAKQTIDILGMLEEKTKGNLATDEETMLKNILYDLRMIFVKEKG